MEGLRDLTVERVSSLLYDCVSQTDKNTSTASVKACNNSLCSAEWLELSHCTVPQWHRVMSELYFFM